jgi:UDP-N-acetylglucosamine--N-acetylmuramyl-(pentapeptide) pyrophosphoryl-undecaprenol N-acetylglucosamine transferase
MIQVNATNFVLAGGSEPGLLLAGLAIADELRAIVPHARFLFAGSGAADECRRVCHAGYEYLALGSPPESRRSRAWRLPWTGWGEERRLLKRIRPAAVISLGGAIGESFGHAAAGQGLPLAVLEQHVTASRATRRLATKAAVVCLGFEETRLRLAANCPVRVTGIPIARSRLLSADDIRASDAVSDGDTVPAKSRRLVILGDGGPRRELSASLPRAISRLEEHLPNWRVVHRTRFDEVRPVQRLYRRLGVDAVTTGHIHNLSAVLARSDLVIAITPPTDVVELAASATPIVAAIGADARECSQVRTARTLAQNGACVVVDEPDQELVWARVLEPLLRDNVQRRQLAAAMQRHLRTDAAWQVASMIRDLVSSPARACVA